MAVTRYFISYYKNDGSDTTDTEMVRGSFVLPVITNIPIGEADWSRQGYSFLGWNEFSDGSGTTYQPGDSITPTSDMAFYALWSVAPSDGVVVSYNGNDIATLNSTGSAVLATDGTLMADDVTITYTEPSPSLQSKNVSPTESAQSIEPDAGYDGLSRVNVGAISSIYVGSSIQRQAAQTITPTTTDQTIASGKYLTGTQTIKGEANLLPENIVNGVTIFGVTGTAQGGGGGDMYDIVIKCTNANGFSNTASDYVVETGSFDAIATKVYNGDKIDGIVYCRTASYDDEDEYWTYGYDILRIFTAGMTGDSGWWEGLGLTFRGDTVTGEAGSRYTLRRRTLYVTKANDDPDMSPTFIYRNESQYINTP